MCFLVARFHQRGTDLVLGEVVARAPVVHRNVHIGTQQRQCSRQVKSVPFRVVLVVSIESSHVSFFGKIFLSFYIARLLLIISYLCGLMLFSFLYRMFNSSFLVVTCSSPFFCPDSTYVRIFLTCHLSYSDKDRTKGKGHRLSLGERIYSITCQDSCFVVDDLNYWMNSTRMI